MFSLTIHTSTPLELIQERKSVFLEIRPQHVVVRNLTIAIC